jgi:hypothetical protein
MTSPLLSALAVTAGLGLGCSAVASPLAVAESAALDFATASDSITELGALAVGSNTVSGTVSGTGSDSDIRDRFRFLLGAGLTISGWSLEITDFVSGGGEGLRNPPNNVFMFSGYADTSIVGNGSYGSGAQAAGLPGTYVVQVLRPLSSTFTRDADNVPNVDVFEGSLSYALTVQVAANPAAPVSEPGALALVGISLGVLGVLRRRRSG